MSVVVVGGGQAGTELAISLRSGGYAEAITIISDEGLPYQRPPLSKAYLSQGGDLDDIILRPAAFYAAKNIQLHSGAAEAIDRVARTVSTTDGSVFSYEHLVLATGAGNRVLTVPGIDTVGAHQLRGLEESHSLREQLLALSGQHIVVAGSGFIGMEIAAAAAKLGAEVTVLSWRDRVMARSVSEPVSSAFEVAHMKHGVDIRHRTSLVAALSLAEDRIGLQLADGHTLQAQLLVVGIGVEPRTDLASAAGLEIDAGILVDDRLRTTVDRHIYAIGDCATTTVYGRARRVESVQNAVDQARFVAKDILGHVGLYRAVPWFWTEQFELKLQIVGLIEGATHSVVRGDPTSNSFSVFAYDKDRLLGVESINRPRDHMAARKILDAGLTVDPGAAADEDVDLRKLQSEGVLI